MCRSTVPHRTISHIPTSPIETRRQLPPFVDKPAHVARAAVEEPAVHGVDVVAKAAVLQRIVERARGHEARARVPIAARIKAFQAMPQRKAALKQLLARDA